MKKAIYILLLLFFLGLVSCKSSSKVMAKQTYFEQEEVVYTKDEKCSPQMQTASFFDMTPEIEEKTISMANLHQELISTALGHVGAKYKYGGTGQHGFDCSGFVHTIFKMFDIALPRSSHEMAEHGTKIKDSEIQEGDLVFFITNGGKRINHVGIVVEVLDDEIKFIHSSTQRGVIVSSTKEPYYKKNYVKAARVLN